MNEEMSGHTVEGHDATRPVALLWGPFNLRLALCSPLMAAPQPLLAFLNKEATSGSSGFLLWQQEPRPWKEVWFVAGVR